MTTPPNETLGDRIRARRAARHAGQQATCAYVDEQVAALKAHLEERISANMTPAEDAGGHD